MKLVKLDFDKDFVVSQAKTRAIDYFFLEDENRYYFTKNALILEKQLFKDINYFHKYILEIQKYLSKDLEILEKILPKKIAKIVYQKPWKISDFQRYDLLIKKNWDYKIIELNSETPAWLPESSCNDLFVENEKNFKSTNENIFSNSKNSNVASIVFYDDQWEDFINAYFQASRFELSEIINISNLELENDWVFFDWRKIKKIYSFYPLEWIFADKGWEKFWQLYLDWHFDLINWPINLITQSKKFWAYICENEEKIFGFLETKISKKQLSKFIFLAKKFLPKSSFRKKDWFLPKPSLEREGNNIWNPKAKNIVYQEYIEQKNFFVKTFEWEKKWYITLWIYCNQKKAIWTYNRFCENKITDYTSYYLPAYFDEKN